MSNWAVREAIRTREQLEPTLAAASRILREIEPLEPTLAAVRSVMRLINVEQIEANARQLRSYVERDYEADARDARAAFHDEQRKGDV